MPFTEKARRRRRELQALQWDLKHGLDVEHYVTTGHKRYKPKKKRVKKKMKKNHTVVSISRYMPTKSEIEEEATRIYMMEEARHGMPAITPTKYELKESGYWRRARHNLMSGAIGEHLPTRREAEAQQRGYLDDMAAGMGLKLVSRKEHGKLSKLQEIQHRGRQALKREKALKKEQKQFRWQLRGLTELLKGKGPQRVSLKKPLNMAAAIRRKGLTKKPKRIPKPRPQIMPKSIYTPEKPKVKKRKVPRGMFGPISIPKTRKYRVTKAISDWKIGQIVNMPTNVDTRSLVRRGFLKKIQPTKKVKPKRKKKKRQKLHTQRSGKTMRVLRKPINDGKKVFAFPDSVWKVKK